MLINEDGISIDSWKEQLQEAPAWQDLGFCGTDHQSQPS
jgi:hypothetical protein